MIHCNSTNPPCELNILCLNKRIYFEARCRRFDTRSIKCINIKFKPPGAYADVHSKADYCSHCLWGLFCYSVLCVLLVLGKRELVADLLTLVCDV